MMRGSSPGRLAALGPNTRAEEPQRPWSRPSLSEALALLALASLFSRSEWYPLAAQIGSVDIRLQDVLFLLLVVLNIENLVRWARQNPAVALTLAIFLFLLAMSGLRSPVGADAAVAVGKYAEFVIAGMAIGIGLANGRYPEAVTVLVVVGTAVNSAVAIVHLLESGGPTAVLSDRADGLLGTESEAAAASLAAIWCITRLPRVTRPYERWVCMAGIASALLAFLVAKSVLTLGCVVAVAALAPYIGTRWIPRAAIAGAAILVALAIGRGAETSSFLGLRSYATSALRPGPVAPVVRGEYGFWPPYERRLPADLTGGSFVHRVALAHVATHIARDAPLFGHGWLATSDPSLLRSGPYDRVMLDRYPRINPGLFLSTRPTSTHNGYLQVWAEAGLLALLALVALLGQVLVRAVTAIKAQGTAADWRMACGLGWTLVVVVYLLSSALFGGQLETALLGAGVVLASSRPRKAGAEVPWLIIGLTVGVALLMWALLVFMPVDGGEPAKLVRATVADRSRGGEVFATGYRFGDAKAARLANGLVTVRAGGDRLIVDTSRRVMRKSGATAAVEVDGLGTARATVVRRTADQVAVEYSALGRSGAVRLDVLRGIPGVFVTGEGSNGNIDLGEAPVLIVGRDRPEGGFAPYPADAIDIGVSQPAIAVDDDVAVVCVSLQESEVRRDDRGHVTVSSRSGGNTFFVGALPLHGVGGVRVRAGEPLSVTRSGAYLDLESKRRDLVPLRRAEATEERHEARWLQGARVVVPYALDAGAQPGVAELASMAATYGGRGGTILDAPLSP
jgi:O-Antigen ligase